MPIDTSMYQAFGTKPKSIADYQDEFAAQEDKQAARESNRLALMIQKGQYGDQLAQRERGNRLMTLAQGVSDPQELIQRMRQGGFHSEADAALKRHAEVEKERAQTGQATAAAQKSTIEAAGTRLKQYRDTLDFIDTPEAAARWITAQFQDPLISGQMAALGSPEQAVSRIPRDPAGFQNWRRQAAMGIEKHIAEMRQQGVADESARHNRTVEGLTARGQNMTDTRARDQLAQQENQFNRTQAAASDKPLNDVQSKALLFGSRMQEADKIIGGLIKSGTKTPSLIKQGLETVPGIGGALGMAANAVVVSEEEQMLEQAQRDFINAVLRRESGAVISDAEFANARQQYFPLPNEPKSVTAQKARNRALATKGILAEVPEAKRGSLTSQNTGGATGDFGDGWVIKEVK